MADVTHNYPLLIQGFELEKSQLEHNVKANLFRIAQTADECDRIRVNIGATQKAIDTLDEKIQSMKAADIARNQPVEEVAHD